MTYSLWFQSSMDYCAECGPPPKGMQCKRHSMAETRHGELPFRSRKPGARLAAGKRQAEAALDHPAASHQRTGPEPDAAALRSENEVSRSRAHVFGSMFES